MACNYYPHSTIRFTYLLCYPSSSLKLDFVIPSDSPELDSPIPSFPCLLTLCIP